MPISESFSVSKIAVDFTLQDGTVESLQTHVVEKFKAVEIYEDAVAGGQTAVLATLPPIETQMRQSMMRISLGNMPANCSANLRAFCNQKLEL